VVYDIGAHHGKWTKVSRKALPAAEYFLFEANPANGPVLQRAGERYYIAALSEEEGAQRKFYLPRHAATTGASLYREQTSHYLGENLHVLSVTTRRLDAFATEHQLPSPDLIKLDVQGAELDVLRGAGALLTNCIALVAELSFVQGNEHAPLVAEMIAGINKLGFRCTDVCKIRRTAIGSVGQIDILFANATLYEKYWRAAGLISEPTNF
jgi:FkbM family methyltransferase